MPYKVVIVEDELDIRIILKAKIESSVDFELAGEEEKPRGLDGKPCSRLVTTLNNILPHQSKSESSIIPSKEDCLYIILDLSFGDHGEDYALGLEVAAFLTQEYVYRDWIRILISTNHNNTNFWQKAYDLGIRVMASKTHALPNIITMLNNLVLGRDYLDGIQIRTDLSVATNDREIEVARLLAMGYSLAAIKKKNLSSATTQKSLFRGKFLENFVDVIQEESINNIIELPPKIATEDEDNKEHAKIKTLPEWGDALFLLYALRQGDPKVIQYVEKVCKVQITIPHTNSQGLFGIMQDNGPKLRK